MTADDFGLCKQIDDAVCVLHDEGVVHCTSVIANGESFEQSVEELDRRPNLQVAIHLNLTDGMPVLPGSSVPTLVSRRGRFLGGRHYAVFAGILSGRFSPAEIHSEWRAQIKKVLRAGIAIQHLNSHGHLHLLPPLQRVVLELVREFDIPSLRLVVDGESPRGWLLRGLSFRMLAQIRRRGVSVAHPARVLGLGHQGGLSSGRILRELRSITSGVAELIVHPSLGDNPHHRRWGYAGEQELRALLADEVAHELSGASATREEYSPGVLPAAPSQLADVTSPPTSRQPSVERVR